MAYSWAVNNGIRHSFFQERGMQQSKHGLNCFLCGSLICHRENLALRELQEFVASSKRMLVIFLVLGPEMTCIKVSFLIRFLVWTTLQLL
jgi:hypothetical protein